mmetsp:Transcript_62759/g.163069  ORF Transcript_62759/g.163069 Transcript_62759/m.163069 type:complete len:200 (+) Transcript_62759:784-1383(+)
MALDHFGFAPAHQGNLATTTPLLAEEEEVCPHPEIGVETLGWQAVDSDDGGVAVNLHARALAKQTPRRTNQRATSQVEILETVLPDHIDHAHQPVQPLTAGWRLRVGRALRGCTQGPEVKGLALHALGRIHPRALEALRVLQSLANDHSVAERVLLAEHKALVEGDNGSGLVVGELPRGQKVGWDIRAAMSSPAVPPLM